MPKGTENTNNMQFTPETLQEYANSEGYIPGLQHDSNHYQDLLLEYSSTHGKLLAGNLNAFAPAKTLMERFALCCTKANDEFVYNNIVWQSAREVIIGNHANFQKTEEENIHTNGGFGRAVGTEINTRSSNENGSGADGKTHE